MAEVNSFSLGVCFPGFQANLSPSVNQNLNFLTSCAKGVAVQDLSSRESDVKNMNWSVSAFLTFLGTLLSLGVMPAWGSASGYCDGEEFHLLPDANMTTIFYPNVEIPKDYEINELPNRRCSNKPFVLNVSVNLADIVSINEKEHMITLETTLGLSWYDRRIQVHIPTDGGQAREYILINRNPIGSIWFPDIFLDHAKDIRRPSYGIPTTFLRAYNDSKLYYSSRVNYDMVCHMSFEDYPVDTQVCDVLFESWSYTYDRMMYKWDIEHSSVNENIRLNQHSYTYNFDTYIGGYKTACKVSFVEERPLSCFHYGFWTGEYPGVRLRLVLKRNISYHLLRTYLPSLLFVTLSWFSMFVPLNHVPGRVGMGMTSLLTTATMFGALTSKTPPISYSTKLDVWFVACITFGFLALFEFTIEIVYRYYWQKIPRIPLFKEKPNKSTLTKQEKAIRTDAVLLRMELWGAALLLMGFIIFNIYYWVDLYQTYTRPVKQFTEEDVP
ncbi:glutamate-gated chloride channel subunit beta-like isoform X2 [Tigriopus californicus]|uniref:glutamate-gated chloride channel subunit beta-like isoform X2 n=1 Tax=Tigriopus californicus TaxID=6832 RepID=UPI0027DA5DED|nr:glutamate-gated chloride channel subunit beta-like isoform X2 [Tigriopus californicus]